LFLLKLFHNDDTFCVVADVDDDAFCLLFCGREVVADQVVFGEVYFAPGEDVFIETAADAVRLRAAAAVDNTLLVGVFPDDLAVLIGTVEVDQVLDPPLPVERSEVIELLEFGVQTFVGGVLEVLRLLVGDEVLAHLALLVAAHALNCAFSVQNHDVVETAGHLQDFGLGLQKSGVFHRKLHAQVLVLSNERQKDRVFLVVRVFHAQIVQGFEGSVENAVDGQGKLEILGDEVDVFHLEHPVLATGRNLVPILLSEFVDFVESAGYFGFSVLVLVFEAFQVDNELVDVVV